MTRLASLDITCILGLGIEMKMFVLIYLYLIYAEIVVELSMPKEWRCRDLVSKWGWRQGEKAGELTKVSSDTDQNQIDRLYLFPCEALLAARCKH